MEMDQEKRIMQERIVALEKALEQVTKNSAAKDAEVVQMRAELEQMRRFIAVMRADREFSVHPPIWN
jgi:predicted  nucleic acid-binding Zn-ribbon protein